MLAEVLEFGEGGKHRRLPEGPGDQARRDLRGYPRPQVEAGAALTITSVLGKIEAQR